MSRGIGVAARVVSVAGLAALSAVHVVWALGSPWPAKNTRRLAEAVVGQAVDMPAAGPTAVIAVGAAATGLLASGMLGDGRMPRLAMRALGTVMLLRAMLGGDVALAALRLPPSGEEFRRLDRRYYRPFAAVLGVSLWFAAADARDSVRRRRAVRQ